MRTKKLSKTKPLTLASCIVFLITTVGTLSSQNAITYDTLPDGQVITSKSTDPHLQIFDKNGLLYSEDSTDEDEILSLIVTFKEPPLSLIQTSNRLSKATDLEMEHELFKSELDRTIQQMLDKASKIHQHEIQHEYFQSINGVSIRCSRRLADHIRSFTMVSSVTPDDSVTILLHKSVPRIQADSVHQNLGITGEGVLIGVIDTGIDYNHPALGGGYGVGYRVVGGHDFVNDDNDPMDDEGHGTHVAGIIGAKSESISGVASDVRFLALKALDKNGRGPNSNIIAAIDFCLDPDGNPVTDDAVDIINMSLGGPPIHESPLDEAVNNASEAGVLCVVAAGNDGNDFSVISSLETISSPGTAEKALTVGASEMDGQIADFSSRGPEPINLYIKPEIVAPGVEIQSCFIHDELKSASGTSMAAPHATGVAALLKELHPDWHAEHLKMAIINSADEVDESVTSPYTYGNGMLDAWDAANLRFLVSPGVLSFGIVDEPTSVWRDTLFVKITNLNDHFQVIIIMLDHALPPGVYLSIQKNVIGLNPNASARIRIILEVDPAVPALETEPFVYTGRLLCRGGAGDVFVPFGFIKTNLLDITSDMSLKWVYLYNEDYSITKLEHPQQNTANHQIRFLPSGTYNVFLGMHPSPDPDTSYHFILKQNLNIPGINIVEVSHREAEFPCYPRFVQNVNDLYLMQSARWYDYFSLSLKPDQLAAPYLVKLTIGGYHQIYITALDTDWEIKRDLIFKPEEQMTVLHDYRRGVQSKSELIMSSGSDHLTPLNIEIETTNEENTRTMMSFTNVEMKRIDQTIIPFLSTHSTSLPQTKTFEIAFSKNKQPFHVTDFDAFNFGVITQLPSENPLKMYQSLSSKRRFETCWFRVGDDKTTTFFGLPFDRILSGEFRIPSDEDVITYQVLYPNDSLIIDWYSQALFPIHTLHHDSSRILVSGSLFHFQETGITTPTGLTERWSTSSQPHEAMTTYQLIDTHNKHIDFEQNEYNMNTGSFSIMNEGRHRLLGETASYSILGQTGRTYVEWEFDTRNSDLSIPSLLLLQVQANERPVQRLHLGQPGRVRFRFYDSAHDIESVEIALMLSAGDILPLTVEEEGFGEYFAEIDSLYTNEYIDVNAVVKDAQGTQFSITASPAFYAGDSSSGILKESRIQLTSYRLDNADDFPFAPDDTLHYTLTYRNDGSLTSENIQLHFPQTPFLSPMEVEQSLDNLGPGRTTDVQMDLVYTQENIEDVSLELQPQIFWTTNNKPFSRTHRIVIETHDTETSIPYEGSEAVLTFRLYDNYPNPFNASTTIRYDLPEDAHIQLIIYDIMGRHVTTLLDGDQKRGQNSVDWDGKDANGQAVPTSIYFYTLKTENHTFTRKLLCLK